MRERMSERARGTIYKTETTNNLSENAKLKKSNQLNE